MQADGCGGIGNRNECVKIVRNSITERIAIKKRMGIEQKFIYMFLKSHRNEFVPEIYECFESDRKLIVIEEYIEGRNLEDILLKNRAEVLNMLLTEYDEKSHMRATYKEGYEEGEQAGYSKGEQALLRKQVQKKLQRGADAETIAEELETELETVKKVIDELKVS